MLNNLSIEPIYLHDIAEIEQSDFPQKFSESLRYLNTHTSFTFSFSHVGVLSDVIER